MKTEDSIMVDAQGLVVQSSINLMKLLVEDSFTELTKSTAVIRFPEKKLLVEDSLSLSELTKSTALIFFC